MDRIIGTYTGSKKGPLLIVFGAMHGNELAGMRALELLFKMLEVEPITNPDFTFHGRVVGLRGNLQAIQQKTRYIERDLNRQWTPENIQRVTAVPKAILEAEDLELRENIDRIRQEIADYQPEHLIVLDIHTTTAFGGIFAIPTEDPESVRIAVELHAPVVKGMLRGIQGSTLHYFNKENMGLRTTPVVFESGQHDEPLSINRAIA
ncbi:MAG: succinylglutamate desuccinylase/aspartoacylase family protein, partial [Phaeodactylibacter sp.]|nr:succinylglutamate desuccinylase/aspartoacylase family protein [Phaeodactylibacter sp.]